MAVSHGPRAIWGVGFWAQQAFIVTPILDLTKEFRPPLKSLPDRGPQPLLQVSDPPNLLLTTLAPVARISRPPLKSLPDRGPQPALQVSDPPNLLLTTLAPITPYFLTYNLFDQPNPRTPQQPALGWQWRQVGMLGQDRLPVGQQIYELTPKAPPRLSYYGTEWRQVGMLGQDKLPAGAQRYELTTPQLIPRPIDPTWTWRQTGMLGRDVLPENQFDWPLPKAPEWPSKYREWAWRQVGMLGLDVVPGQQSYDLAPRAPFRLDQTWTLNLLQTTLAPVVVQGPLGVVANQYDWQLPGAPNRLDQTWTLNLLTTTLAPTIVGPLGVVANQYDWPNPRAPQQPDRTWTWRQVGMLGQDQLPAGAQVTDLTPKLAPRLPLYSWEWRQVGMLGQDRLPAGAQVSDLTPKAAPRLPYYGTEWRQTGMLGQDRLPIGKIVQELTSHRFIAPPIEQTTAWRQVDKLGQDRLPAGAIVTALAVRAPLTAADLYSWVQIVNLALITPPAPPLPIGVMPGNMLFDLPPRGPAPILQPFTGPYNSAFIPPPPVVTGLPHNLPFLATMGQLKSF